MILWRINLAAVLGLLATTGMGCISTADFFGSLGEQTAAKCADPKDSDRLADEVLELVNLERSQRDLLPVQPNDKLTAAAKDFACRMVDGQFFGHTDPETGDGPAERALASKYLFFAIGENLAAGQRSPADVMRVWMESDAHRAIILDPRWRQVGIAVRSGGEHGLYWVQEFGDPAEF